MKAIWILTISYKFLVKKALFYTLLEKEQQGNKKVTEVISKNIYKIPFFDVEIRFHELNNLNKENN